MNQLGPSSELAHRLATRREEWERQQVNATFYQLEQRLEQWRLAVRATRQLRDTHTRADVLNAYMAHGFARATAALVDLGEN